MTKSHREDFEARIATTQHVDPESQKPGIWELPAHVLDTVSGAADFTQTDAGGVDFAQNFSCFAQNIGDFSQGTPPRFYEPETLGGGQP